MLHRLKTLHPAFFAVASILYLFARNSREQAIPWTEVLLPIVAAVTLAAVLWSVLAIIESSVSKAAIGASLLVCWFLNYGHFQVLAESVGALRGLFLMGSLLLVVALVSCTARTRRGLTSLHAALTTASISLVALNLALASAAVLRPTPERARAVLPCSPGPATPDVYFIVLDGYGRSDVLRSYFGYDNAYFAAWLRQSGFYVADSSRANYSWTELYMASALNLIYVDGIPGASRHGQVSRLGLNEAARDSRLVRLLHKRGYEFVSFASGWQATEFPFADRYRTPRCAMTEFQYMVVSQTPITTLLGRLGIDWLFRQRRALTTFILDSLPSLTGGAPRFVFAHISCPHPPYVFGPNGESVNPILAERRQSVSSGKDLDHYPRGIDNPYIAQVEFVTHRIMRTISQLLAKTDRQSVVVLASDHGPLPEWGASSSDAVDGIRMRMPILNACYLPDRDYSTFYNSMTPINTWRLVLNHVFDDTYQLLPDHSYYTKANSRERYNFTNVDSLFNAGH